VQHKSEL